MALGSLFIVFIMMASLGLGLIGVMLIAKKPAMKLVAVYAVAIFGFIIAWLNVTSAPSNFLLERGIAMAIGLLGAAGIIVWHAGKGRTETAAKALVAASVVLGLATLFF